MEEVDGDGISVSTMDACRDGATDSAEKVVSGSCDIPGDPVAVD